MKSRNLIATLSAVTILGSFAFTAPVMAAETVATDSAVMYSMTSLPEKAYGITSENNGHMSVAKFENGVLTLTASDATKAQYEGTKDFIDTYCFNIGSDDTDVFVDGNIYQINYDMTVVKGDAKGKNNGAYGYVGKLSSDKTNQKTSSEAQYVEKCGKESTAGYSKNVRQTFTANGDHKYIEIALYSRFKEAYEVAYSNFSIIDTSKAEAKIGDVYYATLSDAINEATSGSTITLLKDLSVDSNIIGIKKDLTINAADNLTKTVTLNGNIEFDSGTLTISNVTFDGSGNIGMKGASVINAIDCTFVSLQLNGSKDISTKGTIEACNIDTLKTYGPVTLVTTTVDSVVFPKINNGSDMPCITCNDSLDDCIFIVQEIIEDAVLPYILFDGSYIPSEVTVPNGYTYSNGIVDKETVITDEYSDATGKMTSNNIGEMDAPYWTFTKTFTPDDTTISVSFKSGDDIKTASYDCDTTVADSEVVFSVFVKNAPEGLKAKLN